MKEDACFFRGKCPGRLPSLPFSQEGRGGNFGQYCQQLHARTRKRNPLRRRPDRGWKSEKTQRARGTGSSKHPERSRSVGSGPCGEIGVLKLNLVHPWTTHHHVLVTLFKFTMQPAGNKPAVFVEDGGHVGSRVT